MIPENVIWEDEHSMAILKGTEAAIEFAYHAHTDIPKLLTLVRQQQVVIEAARQLVERRNKMHEAGLPYYTDFRPLQDALTALDRGEPPTPPLVRSG